MVKIRNGFISNSSSTSFIITNKTNHTLNLIEFIIENKHLVDEFNKFYDADVRLSDMIRDAEEETILLVPGNQALVFGDEDGTTLGRVYDYILRDGGTSDRFEWHFNEFFR